MSKVLDHKWLAHSGWFDRLCAVLVLGLCSWLGLHEATHWWQILYVCWFILSVPFVLGRVS